MAFNILRCGGSVMAISLLTRDEFRNGVLKRDNYKCVLCGQSAVDAHHIMERRLWPDGGYYLDNGASVCSECHILCEKTVYTVECVRERAKVKKIIPPHLYDDIIYDKWGNIVVSSQCRFQGELFNDESVQKIIQEHLHLFSNKIKYPRTYHLPWSENITNDDRVMINLSEFEGREVVVTEKMDGENTSMYSNAIHARSTESMSHDSQSWVKNYWSKIKSDIPEGWRICGENLYAKHSIQYSNLPSFFLGFSIWDNYNACFNWDDTLDWFAMIGIIPVPVLYRGVFNEKEIRKLWDDKNKDRCEGYVVRIADSFDYRDFRNSVGKYVRKNHVQTIKHWAYGQKMELNKTI